MRTFYNYTPHQQSNWDAAVARYDQIQHENAAKRVAAMSPEDLAGYARRFNTPSDSAADVLHHLTNNSEFRSLVMSGAMVTGGSKLFLRLLDGQDPLDHPPPKRHANSWYEIVESDDAQWVDSVRYRSHGKRRGDAERGIQLLNLDGCIWECHGSSDLAKVLIAQDKVWREEDSRGRRLIWLELAARLHGDVHFLVHYGRWPQAYRLHLNPPTFDKLHDEPTGESLSFADSLFMYLERLYAEGAIWTIAKVPDAVSHGR